MWINSPELQRNFDKSISPDFWNTMEHLAALLPPDLMDTVRYRVDEIIEKNPESAWYINEQLSRLWLRVETDIALADDKKRGIYLKAANDNLENTLSDNDIAA